LKMFRKPKAKGNTRQRVISDSTENEGSEEAKTYADMEPAKPKALVSFDDDEGADDNFEIKKSKRYQKEQRRQRRMEERAAREIKDEYEEEEVVKKEQTVCIKQEVIDDTQEILMDFEDDKDEGATISLTAASTGQIPDSRVVYEAKKKREELRRKSKTSDFIATDNDNKLNVKGERRRLIREEDDDDSDHEVHTFYSAKTEKREAEERRRITHYDMLEKEEETEMDEWERMQIEKAVSTKNVGELKERQIHEEFMMEQYNLRYGDNKQEVEMDIEVTDELIIRGGTNNCDSLSVPTLLGKLQLRMQDREENLNRRLSEVFNLEKTMEENEEDLKRIRGKGPLLKEKHEMLQRMRVYSMCVIECLNVKAEMVNELVDARRNVNRQRKDRIEERRRRDVKDNYEECSSAMSGKDVNRLRTGEHQQRYSDREARKGKRRRDRQGTIIALSHEEGMSSDDEELPSQMVNDTQTIDGIESRNLQVFSDTLNEYSSLKAIMERIVEWLWADSKSFTDSYVSMCLPKLASHFVRLELSRCDLLRSDYVMHEMEWYREVVLISESCGESVDSDVVISLIPSITHKVVVPYLTDVVREEWEPLSLSQSIRLSTFIRTILGETPSLDERSVPLKRLLQAIVDRFNSTMDDELFVPMFGRCSMDNPASGCRSFLDRQFWSAIKLIKCVTSFCGVISDEMISQLSLSISNRMCVVAIQMVDLTEPHVIIKTRSLLSALSSYIRMGRTNELRPLLACLSNVQKNHGDHKDLVRDCQSAIDEISKKL
ncbi:hypothetical protein PFISCL1PPCAC_19976, partial [Pristionchus fissidentatus]